MTRDPLLSSFAAELGRWAQRPPEHPPAIARARVLTALVERPPSARLRAAALALLLLVFACGLLQLLPRSGQEPKLPERPSRTVVVFQLQSGAKVYFALGPEGATKGDAL